MYGYTFYLFLRFVCTSVQVGPDCQISLVSKKYGITQQLSYLIESKILKNI